MSAPAPASAATGGGGGGGDDGWLSAAPKKAAKRTSGAAAGATSHKHDRRRNGDNSGASGRGGGRDGGSGGGGGHRGGGRGGGRGSGGGSMNGGSHATGNSSGNKGGNSNSNSSSNASGGRGGRGRPHVHRYGGSNTQRRQAPPAAPEEALRLVPAGAEAPKRAAGWAAALITETGQWAGGAATTLALDAEHAGITDADVPDLLAALHSAMNKFWRARQSTNPAALPRLRLSLGANKLTDAGAGALLVALHFWASHGSTGRHALVEVRGPVLSLTRPLCVCVSSVYSHHFFFVVSLFVRHCRPCAYT